MSTSTQALAGRHALVTGGARGIGLACARALLARGASVTLLGRDGGALDAAADQLARAGRVQTASADVADAASVRAAFEQAARARSGRSRSWSTTPARRSASASTAPTRRCGSACWRST
ncbi:NAD(P)H-binding protein, PF13460 domain protein [Bordetella pertussis I036]|nr:NAD(P)H-binding protein, PF13460 domain protein [Bordetella pertussis CHLA-13]ETH43188.1 NAD(P)H-binding protein, PF13460 domain protein [Bordetella pertussis H939]ETH61174.1 NAD(P)H-binding protein, PF13460 domain protein [Bordetella pertussis I036]ETH62584.1 NAD(P)H-binding protein, PF13460 domain protein [Bordetella pertussis I176]ETH69290.1 NAD(P)H-binding protein, PF13460 domain protein [Bordetella pertussis STO1-CHLA-0006]ETH72933.1 NAD(P)H-binding protein, PF13460 domain protein [Bor